LPISLGFLLLILFINGLNCTLILDITAIFLILKKKKKQPQIYYFKYFQSFSFIYESAGVTMDSSNNSNDSSVLKKKLEYYKRFLLEKGLLITMQEDEINYLKKGAIKTSNFHI